MANNLHETIINLKNTSKQANYAISNLSQKIKKIDLEKSAAGVLLNDTLSARKMRTIITNLEASSKEIHKITQDLNTVLVGVKDGDGAINYVSKDTTFVNQLEKTMQNIEEGTERFNENMEALKHNFLTRGYFKKQERKQKKEEKKE